MKSMAGSVSSIYLFVFMAVVMEGNQFAVIFINSGCSDNRTAKISTDIFDYCFGITFVRFGINIETIVCAPHNI